MIKNTISVFIAIILFVCAFVFFMICKSTRDGAFGIFSVLLAFGGVATIGNYLENTKFFQSIAKKMMGDDEK